MEKKDIFCNFAGGNIVVEKISANTVYMHQDLRDTDGDWFYWYFAVNGTADEEITFVFTRSRAMGRLGPAVSLDSGITWRWLGTQTVTDNSFSYCFRKTGEVRFCFSMPYVQKDLERFLDRSPAAKNLRREVLCLSREKRKVERIHTCRNDSPAAKVLVTARHHCCEMMAGYVMEGMMESAAGTKDRGAESFENIEFLFIPFVDKDGAENGDQGKNRIPRDHNRDYEGKSLYCETREIREYIPRWSEDKMLLTIDLHCPHINGKRIHMVGSPDPGIWKEQCRFAEVLREVQCGPLKYDPADNVPYGTSWNTDQNYTGGTGCSTWAGQLRGVKLASSFEIPYAEAKGGPVTQETARLFGHDLVRAIEAYIFG